MDGQHFQRVDAVRNRDSVVRVQPQCCGWWQAFWELHPPWEARRDSVVVLHEEASDAPQRVSYRESRCTQIARDSCRDLLAQSIQVNCRRTADEPAVPHEPAPRNQRSWVSGEDDVPEFRTDDPADHCGNHDVRCVVLVQASTSEFALDGPAAREKPNHHHEAVSCDLDGADVENQWVSGHGSVVVGKGSRSGSRPGHGMRGSASR